MMQLALLETGISTCLRCSDLLELTIDGVAFGGAIMSTVTVEQVKTRRAVRINISERAKAAIIALREERRGKVPNWHGRLFPITRERYADMVKEWATMAHRDPRRYSTHSIRKSTPAHIYKKTKDIKACSELLGHADLGHTTAYLGVGADHAAQLREQHEL